MVEDVGIFRALTSVRMAQKKPPYWRITAIFVPERSGVIGIRLPGAIARVIRREGLSKERVVVQQNDSPSLLSVVFDSLSSNAGLVPIKDIHEEEIFSSKRILYLTCGCLSLDQEVVLFTASCGLLVGLFDFKGRRASKRKVKCTVKPLRPVLEFDSRDQQAVAADNDGGVNS